MANIQASPYVPARTLNTAYPLIDSDPHFKRVLRYTRKSDWAIGTGIGLFCPAMMIAWEKWAPSMTTRPMFMSALRLSGVIGLGGGFLWAYQSTTLRFYGVKENAREAEMDMREMVAKVKAGEPLYGKSALSPYMQGVASRNSRYMGFMYHLIPWFNFVNHEHHGVDTAKYYQQAERELEAERIAKGGS